MNFDLDEQDVHETQSDNLVFDLDNVDETRTGFAALPPTTYPCIIDELTYGMSKSSNNPMISAVYKISEGEYEGRKFFDHFVLTSDGKPSEVGLARLKKLLRIICPSMTLSGFNPQKFADSGEGIGERIDVKVKIEQYQGEKRNRVRDFSAPQQQADDLFDQ